MAVGLALLGAPAWALATNAGQPAAPVVGQAGPTNPTAPVLKSPALQAPTPAQAAGSPIERAYAEAVALHGAIVSRDWAAAERHLGALKASEPALKAPAAATQAARTRLAFITPLVGSLDGTVKRRDARQGNDQAYRLASILLAEVDARVTTGGGGGGGVPTASAVSMATTVEHLRQASVAVTMVRHGLKQKDAAQAKRHLDAVREHLKAASGSAPNARLKGAIAELDRRRWRTVAALQDPSQAFRLSSSLAEGFTNTLHDVGRVYAPAVPVTPKAPQAPAAKPVTAPITPAAPAKPIVPPAPGGGGGGQPGPTLQDAPTPDKAARPATRQSRADKQRGQDTVPYAKRDVE